MKRSILAVMREERRTRARLSVHAVSAVLVVVATTGTASAFVPRLDTISFEWRPSADTVNVGDTVDLGLYLVADSGGPGLFSSFDMIFEWDASHLLMLDRDDTGMPPLWIYGFLADPYGLNEADPPLDGDGLFAATAYPGQPISVSPSGTLITTFRLQALTPTPSTMLSIVPSGGTPVGETFIADQDGYRVTGTLGSASVTIVPEPGAAGLFLVGSLIWLGSPRWRRRRAGVVQ